MSANASSMESRLAAVATLAPAAVWQHFATLCRVPRPSKQEAPLRAQLAAWAHAQGWATETDAAGNLLISKPGQLGGEHAPGLVLQGHLDMVCQKNSDSPHDFQRDPIVPVIDGDWLRAPGTTLGADNGLGVALALALLADRETPHPPLEVLLTVDEEAGMGGAHGLQPGWLRGRRMLNLDTEAWGEFYLGCAGGLDVTASRTCTPEAAPEPGPGGGATWRLALTGLRGGHSGVNIHEERGNAIQLLVRVVAALCAQTGARVATLQGGTARNALPREAFATLVVPTTHNSALNEHVTAWAQRLREEFGDTEPRLQLRCEPAPAATGVLPAAEQAIWVHSLQAAPHGVHRMSQTVPGVVETSNNIGIVDLQPSGGEAQFMVRSLRGSAAEALGDKIVSLWALSGTSAVVNGRYPGWTPNPASPLLARCQAVFQAQSGHTARVQVIHAGLECGLIQAVYPDMDIVSFGPTIEGAHAPGEAAHIPSVASCWQLLRDIARALVD